MTSRTVRACYFDPPDPTMTCLLLSQAAPGQWPSEAELIAAALREAQRGGMIAADDDPDPWPRLTVEALRACLKIGTFVRPTLAYRLGGEDDGR